MEPIIVPRPKSVRDPNRAASTLLLAQVKHLREAETESAVEVPERNLQSRHSDRKRGGALRAGGYRGDSCRARRGSGATAPESAEAEARH